MWNTSDELPIIALAIAVLHNTLAFNHVIFPVAFIYISFEIQEYKRAEIFRLLQTIFEAEVTLSMSLAVTEVASNFQ
jgi:hypothetical protein